jgi:hypothetical protein
LLEITCQKEIAVETEQYKLVKYNQSQEDAWEKMVADSVNGTFLHTRKFLSYHGNKFDDQSLLVYDQSGILRAVFPAARDPENDMAVISHPGITYGGLVHDGWLRGQRCLDVLAQLCDFYRAADFKEIIYKAAPWIYHRIPAQDDIYALFRLGANRYRVDLSATVDLERTNDISERRGRALKKAINTGLEISNDFKHVNVYWDILAENLNSKYNKKPVHSVQELSLLKEKFLQEIELITAIDGSDVLAGALLFHCPTLIHAQYFASSPEGRKCGALDLVVEHCIEKSKQLQKRFFDFGISTDQQGMHLNDGLHTFKCEFGAGASVYEFYRITLC